MKPNKIDELTIKTLQQCAIFDGIPKCKYCNVLNCLHGEYQCFHKNQIISNIGDHNTITGIVLSGILELAFYDESGNQFTINYFFDAEIFGAERACYNDFENTVQLKALTDCRILFLDFTNLLDITEISCPYRERVTFNLLRDFARQTQFLHLKLRIIGQKKLRDKLKIYFQTLKKNKDGFITIPFNRKELADFIYADRSALSRELCNMRDEGIIEFHKSKIKILDSDFFS